MVHSELWSDTKLQEVGVGNDEGDDDKDAAEADAAGQLGVDRLSAHIGNVGCTSVEPVKERREEGKGEEGGGEERGGRRAYWSGSKIGLAG
eukprot:755797-Hanusia_phi.AAC.2